MKKLLSVLSFVMLATSAVAEFSKTIDVPTAGTLSTLLTASVKTAVTNLTITGFIDARDIEIMRDDLPLLAVLDISNVTIVSYTGKDGTVGFYTSTYPANEIPKYSFQNSSFVSKISLKTIILPNTVTSIGVGAFWGCSGLTSLMIPNAVNTIGNNSFSDCRGITNITLPDAVTSIGSSAFSNCSALTNIIIPNAVSIIGDYAFTSCGSLTSIIIPNSITTIGSFAFFDCPLTQFLVDTENPNYSSVDGVLFNKNQTTLISYPQGKLGESYIIPNSVTSIGSSAFKHCTHLTNITIPNSVTSIGGGAFSNCTQMTNITISNSATSIGGYAFEKCINLTNITIPNSVTSIGDLAFWGCSKLRSITIPKYITSIGFGAFYGCSILASIYSYAITPANIIISSNNDYPYIFDGMIYRNTGILYVPSGSKPAYQGQIQWNSFNIVEMTTAIQTEKINSIHLYPNPVTDNFHINGIEGIGTIMLSDLNGKILITKQVTDKENILISTLPKGVYILKLTTNVGTVERKVIKK